MKIKEGAVRVVQMGDGCYRLQQWVLSGSRSTPVHIWTNLLVSWNFNEVLSYLGLVLGDADSETRRTTIARVIGIYKNDNMESQND